MVNWIESVDIVQVVSDFLTLRSHESCWVGKCPWCSVKWMFVSEKQQVFYCFYCAAGGNVEEFLDRLPDQETISEEIIEGLNAIAALRGRPFRILQKENTFTCDNCHQTFDKERTDEEALAESQKIFGVVPEEEQTTVCDECYNEMMAWWASGASNN